MNIKLLTIPLAVAMAILFSMAFALHAEAKSEIYKNWREIAIKGYDPVAYHKDGKPVKGSSEYEFKWKDAKWRFASAEHRDLFEADPERYAPRYGGYCAWAVAQGYTASVDPKNAWSIVEGKLYLNYDVEVKEKWEKDIPGNITKADANWPGVLN
jgi:hypothetical protein